MVSAPEALELLREKNAPRESDRSRRVSRKAPRSPLPRLGSRPSQGGGIPFENEEGLKLDPSSSFLEQCSTFIDIRLALR
jgi:hypothetical protein